MNMIRKSINFLFIATLLLASACGDDEEAPQVSRKEMMTGSWTLQMQALKNISAILPILGRQENLENNPLVEPYLEGIDLISDDAVITFREDNTYTIDSSTGDNLLSGTWELQNDERDVSLSGFDAFELFPSDTIVFNILVLTDTNLSLVSTISGVTLEDLPTIGTVRDVSVDYQIDFTK